MYTKNIYIGIERLARNGGPEPLMFYSYSRLSNTHFHWGYPDVDTSLSTMIRETNKFQFFKNQTTYSLPILDIFS